MRLKADSLICECGQTPRAVGDKGVITCDNPLCPENGRRVIIHVTRKTDVAAPRKQAVAPAVLSPLKSDGWE